jgi:hypothetical protein
MSRLSERSPPSWRWRYPSSTLSWMCGNEARDERDGLTFSLGARSEAVSIYGTCRDRDAALLPTVATKLLEAAGFAGLALAVADEV